MTSKSITNQNLMKQQNRKSVLYELWQNSPISRTALAEKTGLNKATITLIANELIETGIAIPCGSIKNGVGRSRNLLSFNENYGLCGGVLFRASSMRVVIGNMNAKILWEYTLDVSPTDSPMETLTIIGNKLEEGFKACESFSKNIIGIGVGTGSLLTPGNERIYAIHSINWRDIPVVEYLKSRFHIPIVADTASNNAMMAEKYLGIARDVNNAIYLSVGYGIGAGLLLNNKLFHGAGGFAGDIGHMVVEPNGPVCACGKRGCWEVVASSIATGKSFREMAELADKGDVETIAALTQLGRALGKGIANLINVLNPELVIIGGRSVLAEQWLAVPCKNAIKSMVWPIVWDGTRIEFTDFGKNTDIIGTLTRVVELLF